jgi:hypothetical protein
MVVRKITISLEEGAYQAAVAAAKAAGMSLSAWLSRYAEHRARVDEGLRAVAAYEAEYGTDGTTTAGAAAAAGGDPGTTPAGTTTTPAGTAQVAPAVAASVAASVAADGVLDELGVGASVPPARDAEYAAALDRLRGRAA